MTFFYIVNSKIDNKLKICLNKEDLKEYAHENY